jgi:hypothetical protein
VPSSQHGASVEMAATRLPARVAAIVFSDEGQVAAVAFGLRLFVSDS